MIRATNQPYLLNSLRWSEHFQDNISHMDHIPWHKDQAISEDQKKAISHSIAVFQLGESSEGNSFRRAGELYANETGDYEYLHSLDLFIKEENRHSEVLARFMRQQGISELKEEWTDNIFRCIRKIAGLNICISVLLTAEIIAANYYRALGRATKSPVLRAICDQILIDEAHHLNFQACTLGKQRRSWSLVRRWFANMFQRSLMLGTIVLVWHQHGRVYRAGGYRFGAMAREAWACSNQVLAVINQSINNELPDPSDTQMPERI